MVRIRLRRVGAKKQPSYRIVVADQRSPRDGRFIESIGHYNPRTEPETVVYDEERALHWLSVGAQPSEAVARLFNNLGTYGRLERLRQGEEVDALVDEAQAEAETRGPVSPKTRHAPGMPSKKRSKKEEAAEEVAEVVEEEEAKADEAVAEAVEEEEAEAEEAVAEAVDEEEPEAEEEQEPEAEVAVEEPEGEAEAETTGDEDEATESEDTEETE